jgi:hypothetical protein
MGFDATLQINGNNLERREGERQGEDKVTLRISFYYYHDFTKDKALH